MISERIRNEKGFTLIEILVSLAIIAVALPPLLRAFTHAAREQKLSANEATALYLLKFQMAQIELEGFPEIGEEEGEFGEGSRYTWTYSVEDVTSIGEEMSEIEDLRKITITVNWQEEGRERSLSMVTYISEREMPQPEGTQAQAQGQSPGGM